jgi:hypothetical protein
MIPPSLRSCFQDCASRASSPACRSIDFSGLTSGPLKRRKGLAFSTFVDEVQAVAPKNLRKILKNQQKLELSQCPAQP